MALCGVDILVAQHIRNEVNIACFAVELRAVRGAELMRGDLFQRGDREGIFFHKLFHGAHRDPAVLHGQEEGIFRALLRLHFVSLFQVDAQLLLNLIAEIDNRVVSALAVDPDSVLVEVDILHIESHAFAHTDSGPQKECQQSHVARLRFLMVFQLCLRQPRAVLHLIQEPCHLVRLQPDDRLGVALGHGNEGRHILFDQLRCIEVAVHAAQGRQLARFPAVIIGVDLSLFFIIRAVFQEVLDVLLFNAVQHGQREIMNFHFRKDRVVLVHIFEENPEVIGIGKPRPRLCCLRNPAEKLPAERGELPV